MKHCPCCGNLHMKGSEGFANDHGDRVADAEVKGSFGGPMKGPKLGAEGKSSDKPQHWQVSGH